MELLQMEYTENKIGIQTVTGNVSREHGIIHKVKDGETMYIISRQYHIPLTELMYANPYVDVYNLISGDELLVPVSQKQEAPSGYPSMPQTQGQN